MRSLNLRRAALAAVVPLTLGSLAACGSSGSTAADPQAGAPSSPSTPGGSTKTHAHQRPHAVVPAAFLSRVRRAAHTLTTARFTMTMDINGASVYAKGALDLTHHQPAMRVSMDLTGMGTVTDMRIVDGAVYVEAPTGTSQRRYLKMDLASSAGSLGQLSHAFDSFDPNATLDQLSPETFENVTDLGGATVAGRPVEHYRVKLDTASAAKAFGALPGATSLPKTIDYELWLDHADRIAKFTMSLGRQNSITATYSDYGSPVSITAPPASQVTEGTGSTTSS